MNNFASECRGLGGNADEAVFCPSKRTDSGVNTKIYELLKPYAFVDYLNHAHFRIFYLAISNVRFNRRLVGRNLADIDGAIAKKN